MYHLMQSSPTEFLSHYYKRENAEATFAAIKKKLGKTLSSKDSVAQVNELLCKVIVHNIQILIQASFERGIPLPGRGSSKSRTAEPPSDEPPSSTAVASSEQFATSTATWQSGDN
jgi:hypothetical protein